VIEKNYIEKTKEKFNSNPLTPEEKARTEDLLAQQMKKDLLVKEKIQAFMKQKQTQYLLANEKQIRYAFHYVPDEINSSIKEKTDLIHYFLDSKFIE
jgi:hypothetical protein